MITREDLRTIHTFEDLDEAELDWLAEHFEEQVFSADELIYRKGDPADWMIVMFEGEVLGTVEENGRELAAFTFERGTTNGLLPGSRMKAFRGPVRATKPSRAARLHKQHFPEMLERIPVLRERLTHMLSDRVREGTKAQLQNAKLASLGTMAAGLAHELNNPASAAKRAAQNLCDTLQVFDELASKMLRQMLFKAPSPDGEDPFQPIYDITERGAEDLDPVTQGEREDDLADWLEEQGVETPWEDAATLVASGFTRDLLASFAERLKPEHVGAFLAWMAQDMEMRQLCNELAESTERISSLVGAMKSYSYMDQANDKQPLDLHKGIDDTLTILKHKLKAKNIQVTRAYEDLPPIKGYGGELNQVWTNLLDNAIDAVEEGGQISVETRHDAVANVVQVDVIDNGVGIPEEIQSRIFDPFYTTKGPGSGTGLGLDIAYRIVTRRHAGTIRVHSVPGHTRFAVRIPVEG